MAVVPDRRWAGESAELVLFRSEVDIVRDEEIEIAVTIDIEERAARAPQRGIGAARVRDFAEPATTRIPIQRVRSDVGDIQVDQAVVVVVARACAHPVLAMADARGSGHVLKRSISAVPEQPMACALGDGWICERAAVHEKDVEPAIVIKVEEQAARPEDLGHELLVAGAADMREVQPRRHGDISEDWQVRSDVLSLGERSWRGLRRGPRARRGGPP